ncbi:MAG: endonuclease/exonuclease/phosphatase family protein [Clostridia bacterium]|nr:endonuclease/exonuclease/phosphatase family protein [Clostridia bacterium]
MRVLTYNICHGRYVAGDMQKIADILRQISADLVGLQEVDVGTTRVDGRDLLRELSEMSGYVHAAFCPSMTFEGGYYGTAVLSRTPLRVFSSVRYTKPGREPRTYSRCETEIDGRRVAFFNTHCANKEPDVRLAQQRELSAILTRETLPYVATGDFNDRDFSVFSEAGIRAANGEERRFVTFPAAESGIDNILFSRAFSLLDAGTVHVPYSDHFPLYADLSG